MSSAPSVQVRAPSCRRLVRPRLAYYTRVTHDVSQLQRADVGPGAERSPGRCYRGRPVRALSGVLVRQSREPAADTALDVDVFSRHRRAGRRPPRPGRDREMSTLWVPPDPDP